MVSCPMLKVYPLQKRGIHGYVYMTKNLSCIPRGNGSNQGKAAKATSTRPVREVMASSSYGLELLSHRGLGWISFLPLSCLVFGIYLNLLASVSLSIKWW